MNAMIPLRKGKARAIAAVLIVATALAAVPAGAGQRRGAQVLATTRLGGTIEGELIAVKPASILLLEPSGRDNSIGLVELRSVRVLRKSKSGVGGLLGLAVGASAGYFGGFASAASSGACPDCEAPLSGYMFGIIGGLVGLGAGVMIGGEAGRDVDFQFRGLTEPAQATQLRKLRQYARVASPL